MKTVKQIAADLNVKIDKVLSWIASGELPAINVALRGSESGKPRWRIRQSDFDAFVDGRMNRKRQRQPKTQLPPVIEFIK